MIQAVGDQSMIQIVEEQLKGHLVREGMMAPFAWKRSVIQAACEPLINLIVGERLLARSVRERPIIQMVGEHTSMIQVVLHIVVH